MCDTLCEALTPARKDVTSNCCTGAGGNRRGAAAAGDQAAVTEQGHPPGCRAAAEVHLRLIVDGRWRWLAQPTETS